MTDASPSHRALEELLISMFTVPEFERLLRSHPPTVQIQFVGAELVTVGRYFQAAVAELAARGLIDGGLFDELVKVRPRRGPEIRAVQALFA